MTSGYAGARGLVQCAIGLVMLVFATLVPAVSAQTEQARATAAKPARTLLVMGDSLSAAYGLSASQGWVALTAERVAKARPGWRVVNASISGETTAGGVSRIAGELKRSKPAVVVIELGANDGLRGLPLAQTRSNLERMITLSQASGAKVLLVGMRMPPNLGRDYTQGFERNFSELAKLHKTAFLPFLLAPIAMDRANFQPDNLHPVAAAQPKLRDHVWQVLVPLLK
ncbi:MAG: arylesterase [Pseudoxanthomonas sp.]